MAETVGWLADKISIMELKIYHMREQTEREDATAEFRERCSERLAVLQLQRDDLAAELEGLLRDLASGRVVPRLYRQFKMYNDPQYRSGQSK
jgi:DNA-binding TFAR19-related protein (PDSD5 family)